MPTQNFDAVTAPARPTGINYSNAAIVTTAVLAASAPNSLALFNGTGQIEVAMLAAAVDGNSTVAAKFAIQSDGAEAYLIGRANANMSSVGPDTFYYARLRVLASNPGVSDSHEYGIYLGKFVNGVETQLTPFADESGGITLAHFDANVFYLFSFTMNGTTLSLSVEHLLDSFYLKPSSTFSSGAANCLSVTDSSIPATGTQYAGLGLKKAASTSAPKTIYVDDFSATALAAPRTVPATFYIDNAGSDSADGLTTGTAWATVGKINTLDASGYFIPGDMFRFKKGGQWTTERLLIGTSGTTSLPIMVGSYGASTLQPVILGGRLKNASGFMAQGIHWKGPGVNATTGVTTSGGGGASGNLPLSYTGVGFDVQSDTTAQVYDQGVSLIDCEVDDHTAGILIRSIPATTGTNASRFDNVSITTTKIHDCLHTGIHTSGGNSTTAATNSFGFYAEFLHRNFYIADCELWNIFGDPNATVWSGVVIQVNNVDGGVVERCVSRDSTQLLAKNTVNLAPPNNYKSGGGGGIIQISCRDVVFRQCQAYNHQTVLTYDACGFDIDANCVRGIIENCISSGNWGAGYQGGTIDGLPNNVGCIIRWNLSIGDGQNPQNVSENGVLKAQPCMTVFGNGGADFAFYGNTIHVKPSPATVQPTGFHTSMAGSTSAAKLVNNAFYAEAGCSFVHLVATLALVAGNRYHSASGTPLWKTGATNTATISTTLTQFRTVNANYEGGSGTAAGSIGDPMLKNPAYTGIPGFGVANSTIDAFDAQAGGALATAGINLSALGLSGYPALGGADFRGNARAATSQQVGASATLYSPTDTTPPTLGSLAINSAGTTLTGTFSETGCTPSSGQGGFTLPGTTATVGPWTISGTTFSASLVGTVYSTQTPTATYNRAATTSDIADAAGNYLANFTGASVTNNSTQTAPVDPGTDFEIQVLAELRTIRALLAEGGGTESRVDGVGIVQTMLNIEGDVITKTPNGPGSFGVEKDMAQ